MQRPNQKPYRQCLRSFQSLCGLNYGRLMRLKQLVNEGDQATFHVQEGGQDVAVTLTVLSRAPYTTEVSLFYQRRLVPWLPAPVMKIRLYHDVRLAEVVGWHNSRHFQGRYDYPNEGMFHPDEKIQLNGFLGECLNHCLEAGYSSQSVPVGR